MKIIKYKLVELKPALKIRDVDRLDVAFETINIFVKDDPVQKHVDWNDTLLIEFTGKFSKEGKPIWSGDILELKEAYQSAPAGLYIVSWIPGAFMAFHAHETISVPLFDEACVAKMEHKGNQFENPDVLQKYLEQFKDIELKAEALPQ